MINRRSVLLGAMCSLATPSLALAATQPGARLLTIVSANSSDFASVVYRRGNNYDAGALDVLDHTMRDWRQDEHRQMDRGLYDILYEIQEQTRRRKPNLVLISGYRTSTTNEMLRKKSKSAGVAKTSLHLKGMAADIRVPGIPTRELRQYASKSGKGGVGYYPASNFVHVDTGPVRFW